MPSRRHDLPVLDVDTETWWRAAADQRLLLRRCRSCGEVHHYPRPFCPTCWSDDVAWIEARGRATLYTYSIVHRNDLPPFDEQVPYVAAVVELEEGPRLMTQIVDCGHDQLSVGMSLELAFRELADDPGDGGILDGGLRVPVFRPVQ